MKTQIQNSRSDKLLITLSHSLAKASSLASEALLTWQELVETERRLEEVIKRGEKEKDYKRKVEELYGKCRNLAFDLKGQYDQVDVLLKGRAKNGSQLLGLIQIPIRRLVADYGPTFKA
jgi:hypothetical protein